MVQLYNWQKKAIARYRGKGILSAVTGAGKTLTAVKIVEKVGGSKIVCAPSLAILEQWKVALRNETNIEYYTFQTLCKKNLSCKLLVIDEAHRSVSPEFIKLYNNVKYKYILGLTATPNKKCIEKCGKPICKIEFDEANVAPFKVHFIGVDLSFIEQKKYRSLSYNIGQIMQRDYRTLEEKQILDALILKRRRLVYNATARIPLALKLIQDNLNLNKKVLVICQRIDQANVLSHWFTTLKVVPHVVYHSNQKDNLDKYKNNEVKLCISVGMLKEGFDDPDTDVGIIVSTTLSKSFNIQAIGRVIRYKKGKKANVYIILANETTDLKVLDFSGLYDFDVDNIKGERNPPALRDAYYGGEKFSFVRDSIWKTVNNERVFMQKHFITKYLKRIKPQGGSFTVSDKGVYTKVDRYIHQVYPKFITLTPLDKPLFEKIDVEELLKEWE